MKIGLFSDTYHPFVHGITYAIDAVYDELVAQGHEVYIIAPAPSVRYKEEKKHIIRFPAIKDMFFDDQLTSIFFPPAAINKIKALDLDLIHFFTPGQIGLLSAYVAIKNNIPLITTYSTGLYETVKHYPAVFPGLIALSIVAPIALKSNAQETKEALLSMRPKKNLEDWSQNIVKRMITVLHNRCDRIVVPSLKSKKQLLAWDTKTEIDIIPTGIDPLPVDVDKAAFFKEKFDIQAEDKVLLFVGRLAPEKNPEFALESFAELAEKNAHAKLLMVGDHSSKKKLQEKAKELLGSNYPRIIFAGTIPREELGSVYALADVFIFTSLADTQGLVVNEAIAAGLPVVMIDKEVTEAVKDGINGYFAENNPADFAEKVQMIIKDKSLKEKMSKTSTRISRQYTSRAQAGKLARVYAQLLKEL